MSHTCTDMGLHKSIHKSIHKSSRTGLVRISVPLLWNATM